MDIYHPGQKVKYKGRGFLGFDPNNIEMEIVEVRKIDIVVMYKGSEMSVLHHEIQSPESQNSGRFQNV